MNRTRAVLWFEQFVTLVAIPLAILLSRLAYGADDSVKDRAKGNRSVVETDAPRPAQTDLFGDPLPAGAALRLGTVRFRVTGRGEGLAFAADDKTLVMNGQNRRLVLVDAATGLKALEISTGEQRVTALRLTPDRSSVVAFGHEFIQNPPQNIPTAQRFDLASGKMLSKVPLDKAFGEVVAVDQFGKTAITRGGKGLLAVWDMIAGKELLSHNIGEGRMNAAALSPDGALLAAADSTSLYLWEPRSGKEATKIDDDRRVQSLAFSPDGAILAEGPGHGTEIVLRDVMTHKVLQRLSDDRKNHMYVNALSFTSDGRSLIAGNAVGIQGIEARVHVWDVATGKIRQQFATAGMKPYYLALSSDDSRLAAAGGQSVVKVWDLDPGRLTGDDRVGHEATINSILFTADGATIVTSSDDWTVRTWDSLTGRPLQTLRHGYWVRGVAISPDGRLIASRSLDDTVRLWELATGKEVYRLPGHGQLGGNRPIMFTPDGTRIIESGDDYYLRAWDVKTGKADTEVRVHPDTVKIIEGESEADTALGMEELPVFIQATIFLPEARRFAITLPGSVTLFDVDFGKELTKIGLPDGNLTSLACSPESTRIATSWENENVVRVYDLVSGKELLRVPLPDSGAGPLTFSSDGKFVAVANGSNDAEVRVLDSTTGELVQLISGIPELPRCLAFSPDGRRLACGFSDGTALVWDLKRLGDAP